MPKSLRDPNRESYWRNVLDRQRLSGLNARAFCRRDGLAESSFHFWRRTIRQRDASGSRDSSGSRAAPVFGRSPAFVPAVVCDAADIPMPDTTTPGITIDLRGGRVLRLPAAMPLARVAELIRALEDVSIAGDAASPAAEVAS